MKDYKRRDLHASHTLGWSCLFYGVARRFFYWTGQIKIMFSPLWREHKLTFTNPRDAAANFCGPSDREAQGCGVIGDPFILRIDRSSIYRAFFSLPLPLRRPGLLRRVCLGYSAGGESQEADRPACTEV